MSCFLKSDVWLLMIGAAVISAVLVCNQSSTNAAKLGAFFTVLGDAIVLLALCGSEEAEESETVSS